MRAITKKVLLEIREFATPRGYKLSQDNPILCPQVNGLTSLCLAELGIKDITTLRNFCSSALERRWGLYYREVCIDETVKESALNTCKNSCLALGLIANGNNSRAREIMRKLKYSPVYLKEIGLLGREFNPENHEVNEVVYTQSNLWAALAYYSLGEEKKSQTIIEHLEKSKLDRSSGLFLSSDCRNKDSELRFFTDDQALAILAYSKIGQDERARALMNSVLSSPLYDSKSGLFNSSFSEESIDPTKSTYKNSLMAFALGKLGYDKHLSRVQKELVKELYNPKSKLFKQSTRDDSFVPDNSALALVALEYKNIKHKVF